MPQTLPSFVELLDSLDLEGEGNSEVQHYAHFPASPSFVSSSPSSLLPSSQASPGKFLTNPASAARSFSISPSPSIVISHASPVSGDFATSRRKSISNRYNPYDHPNYFTRRRSLPNNLLSYPDQPRHPPDHFRASSASPPITDRRAFLGYSSNEQSTHLSTTRTPRAKADQPISAFVRRRHPYISPAQSHEYRKPTRSVSPTNVLAPVSLPSLPPLPRISPGTDSLPPSFSVSPHLPSISMLDHSLTATSERHDPGSRATSRTPTPPSCKAPDHRDCTSAVGNSPR